MNFSKLDSFASLFAGTAAVAAIVITQPNVALALTPEEVYEIAVPVTVLITSPNSGGGSGVIIAREGNTYTVLTNDHVVCDRSTEGTTRCAEDTPYLVQTHDGQSHSVIATRIKRFHNGSNDPDLAIVQFTSPIDYPVATLGNSDEAEVYQEVYAYGFPGYVDSAGYSRQESQAPRGFITDIDVEDAEDGYTLAHDAVIWHGLSGSPLFDAKGRVIGINGSARTAYVEAYQSTSGGLVSSGLYVPVDTGIYLAIPINTFVGLLPESGLNLANLLNVDNTPAPSIRQRLRNPESAEDFYVRGIIRATEGDFENAIEDFDRAIELDSEFIKAYYQRSVSHYQQGNLQQASADLDRVIQLDSSYTLAYSVRGFVRAISGDYQGAIEDLNRAIELDPNDATAYTNRGAIRSELRNRNKIRPES
ncbi:MAG: serine protease [Cyanobacteria bacterium CRU_2_1]|nr:serine protease [Cyanobacteria bacterium RU_5_0]NJR57595.1 serine protease [Cyanobacteria bacterium CRU_2_1]